MTKLQERLYNTMRRARARLAPTGSDRQRVSLLKQFGKADRAFAAAMQAKPVTMINPEDLMD